MILGLPRITVAFVSLLLFAAFSVTVLPPRVSSDSVSYIDAVMVLDGLPAPAGFVPNRLITTYGGLQVVRGLTGLGFNPFSAWIFMNMWFYALGLSAFYLLLRDIFGREREAILGVILLGASYPAIAFGLNFLMDMGGWAAYLLSVFCSYAYFTGGKRSYALGAAGVIGVGVLFKEYAALAILPLAAALLFRIYRKERGVWVTTLLSGILAATPLLLLYAYFYRVYGYTYLDWLVSNESRYGSSYASTAKEFIKVFGSLLTFLWFLALPGMYLLIRRGREMIGSEQARFVGFLFLSSLPLFIWPAITQRIYFIPVACLVIASLVAIRKLGNRYVYVLPLLFGYVIVNYTLDSYILPNFSSDVFLNYFF